MRTYLNRSIDHIDMRLPYEDYSVYNLGLIRYLTVFHDLVVPCIHLVSYFGDVDFFSCFVEFLTDLKRFELLVILNLLWLPLQLLLVTRFGS